MRARFGKRTYRSLAEFLSDVWFLIRNSRQILVMTVRRTISPSLRERLMLAVIAVYRCRYCTWVHTRASLREGLKRDEINSLLAGSVNGCPDDEALAVLYAQHWADANGQPTAESLKMLVDAHGEEKANAINITLRMIRVGNLTGNTWDHLLHRVSFGKLGT